MRTARKDVAAPQGLGLAPKARVASVPEPPAVNAYGFKGPQYALAVRRVGVTPEERFAWLVRFVQRPPEDFADPYLLEVREELFVFGLHEAGPRSTFSLGLDYLTQERTQQIASRAQTMINSLLTAGEWKFDGPVALRLKRMPDGSIVDVPDKPQGTDLWLWAIKTVLCRHGSRLAKCARPGCDRKFVRHKAGLYCSSSCSHKVRNARRNQLTN
jgi:hypothetical protein